jgi:hypothetical protein
VVAAGTIGELTGIGRGVLVEVDGDAAALATVLRERGADVELDGARLVVNLDAEPGLLYDVVRDAVVVSGVGLRRLTDRTIRLQDVFLEVGA